MEPPRFGQGDHTTVPLTDASEFKNHPWEQQFPPCRRKLICALFSALPLFRAFTFAESNG
jgi:hypothetical protein